MSITTTRPPGAHTRTISRSTLTGSRKWCMENRVTTMSNVPSA